jgi:hypothetical protein
LNNGTQVSGLHPTESRSGTDIGHCKEA